jgi:hypothetical protein
MAGYKKTKAASNANDTFPEEIAVKPLHWPEMMIQPNRPFHPDGFVSPSPLGDGRIQNLP